MAKSIEEFLVELDTNSELMAKYKKDPVGTAKKYGLSDEEVKLIEDQSWDEVEKRFNDTKRAIRIISY